MADYIEKEQLKNSVKRYFKHLIDKGKYKIDVLDANADIHKIISELPAIERLPAADAVQVVRCENCAFSYKQIEFKNLYVCLQNERFVKKNDFCSYGERKTDNA